MRIRIRRILRYWPAAAIAATVILIYAAWPGRWTFTVSPETTYFTEPLDADGFVDYPAALNERMRKGVTPENNANVVLWRALGPHPEGATMPPGYFQWLGIPAPPEEGEYFVLWRRYVLANVKAPPDDAIGPPNDPSEEISLWEKRLDRLTAWPWDSTKEPQIADWLKRNENPLALVIESLQRPQYFNPLVSNVVGPKNPRVMNSLLANVDVCREIARALRCRAMERAFRNDFDGAWADLLACQRLGRMIARGGSMLEALAGLALVATATSGEITLLGQGRHSSQRIMSWLADLKALPPFPPVADKFDLGERIQMLDSHWGADLDFTKGANSESRLGDRLFTRNIDWDPTFRNANRVFDQLAVASRLPDRASRKAAFAEVNGEVEQALSAARKRNALEKLTLSKGERGEAIGNIWIGLQMPLVEKMQDSHDRLEQTQANLQIAFALAAYRADTGRYPARLDELAPKYLPSVPGDLFSGKPLIYRPTEKGYLFYSVGVNGIDEDGRWMDDEPKGDDLRVRMPVEEPKAK